MDRPVLKEGDAGVVHLEGLKRLRMLLIDSKQVTPDGPDALQAALPGLTVMR